MSKEPTNVEDTLDITPRCTIWLNSPDRAALLDSVENSLNGDASPETSPIWTFLLQQVRTELNVVEARGAFYETQDDRARYIENLDKDAEPVRLSEDELKALLALPSLPEHLVRPIAAAIRRGRTEAGE